MDLTVENARNILDSYLKLHNLSDSLIEIQAGCNKSDGYVSYIFKITIRAVKTIKHDAVDERQVIIKCAPINEHFRTLLTVRQLYLSEIYFYEQILPEFYSLLCNANKRDDFAIMAEFITAIKTPLLEAIALEDVRPLGYSMRDKRLPLDDAHLTYIMQEYGKFHAISFALKYKSPGIYRKLIQGLRDIHEGRYKVLNEHFYDWFRPPLRQTIQLFESQNKTEISNKLIALQTHFVEFLQDVFEYRGKYEVIAHLDCWSNNMLFKYENEQPISMYLLDYQYVYNTSPVIDILYLFYVGAGRSEYSKLEHYLKGYYRSLNQFTSALGVDLQEIYTYEDFLSEWKLYARYGYLRGILGIPLSLRNQEDIIDVKDVIDNNIQSSKALSVDKWSDECVEWITELTEHMIKNEFIS